MKTLLLAFLTLTFNATAAESPIEMKTFRQLIRCLRANDSIETQKDTLRVLKQNQSISEALKICKKEDSISIALEDEKAELEITQWLQAFNPAVIRDCRGITLSAGGAFFYGPAAQAQTLSCRTAGFRTVFIIGGGVSLAQGMGVAAGFVSISREADLEGRVFGPLYVGTSGHAIGGLVLASSDDYGDWGYRNGHDDMRALKKPRGIGWGGYDAFGVNAGVRVFTSITRQNLQDFEKSLSITLKN
jgi:hypothetical protein